MLLTLSTTHRPATDLGFLLHKNPGAIRSVPLSFGTAHVFYPEATEQRCTAALLDVDPVALVRGKRGSISPSAALAQYVAEALNTLYVLLPVLDDDKHYWVSRDEIDKLLRRGGNWLRAHPERELITRRYLRYQGSLAREALARLLEEDQSDPDLEEARHDREEEQVEKPIGLRDQRIGAVLAALRAAGARQVLDLGCGDGRLLQALLRDGSFDRIVGVDVSYAALEKAARRLRLEQMSPKQRERIELLQSSLTYRDRRLEGYEAAAVVEVIEHLDPPRLRTFERNLFGASRPGVIVLTTPNVEHNVRFESLPAGSFRHRDHRFEWTREQFRQWATQAAEAHGYTVRFLPIGPDDPEVGPPTQMAVFNR